METLRRKVLIIVNLAKNIQHTRCPSGDTYHTLTTYIVSTYIHTRLTKYSIIILLTKHLP